MMLQVAVQLMFGIAVFHIGAGVPPALPALSGTMSMVRYLTDEGHSFNPLHHVICNNVGNTSAWLEQCSFQIFFNPEDVFCFLLDTEQGEVLNQYVDIPNEFFTDNTCYEDMICLKPRVVFEMTCDPATKPLSNETTTVSDLECQNWMSQYPHAHDLMELHPNASLGDHNMCRNPDNEPGDWCYTMNETVRKERCREMSPLPTVCHSCKLGTPLNEMHFPLPTIQDEDNWTQNSSAGHSAHPVTSLFAGTFIFCLIRN